jgi:thiosulfate/3-mercaptopyruvate sulfurtransferase
MTKQTWKASAIGLCIAYVSAGAQQTPLVVTTEWLAAHLGDSNVVVIQAGGRQPDPKTERIPGSRYVPYMGFAPSVNGLGSELPSADSLRSLFARAGVSDNSHVILTGQPLSVTRAFYSLDFLGHPRVSVLDGGFTKWKREGRPVETTERAIVAGRLSSRQPRADVVVSTDWVREHAGKPGIALCDTRTENEYIGADGANGHITGARLIEWRSYFTNTNDIELADRATLERLFNERAAPGDTIVAYCAVGYRASGTYFISRVLGVPVKLYDGSYDAWSKRGLPVVTAATPLRNGKGLEKVGGALPAVSPDGRFIAFTAVRDGKQSDTYVVRADGSQEKRLTETAEWDERPSWIAGRVFASVRSGDSAEAFIVGPDGSGTKRVATVPGREVRPSPDGDRLLALSGVPMSRLLLLSSNGSSARAISDTTKPPPTAAAWSPDGKRIAYATFDLGATRNLQIGVMNADGSDAKLLTKLPSSDGRPMRPAWSPDGTRIAFHASKVETEPSVHVAHIYVLDVATGALTKLAPHDKPYLDEAPSWFPDGNRIAFQSDRTGTMQVWVMNADGTGARQVTRN